jgi:phosphate transport system protein
VLLEDLGQDLVMMARLVQAQVVTALTAFFQKDVPLAGQVAEKDDQVDNLLSLIEDTCFRRIVEKDPEGLRARQSRGALRVAQNLEKLGDYAVNIAEQTLHLSRLPAGPMPFDLPGSARVALAALDQVIESFTEADAEKAKAACRCETELDDPAFLITTSSWRSSWSGSETRS